MYYTTLSKLKKFLKIEENNSDEELENIIRNATSLLDNEFWWNLGLREYSFEREMKFSRRIITFRPIKKLISVTFEGQEQEIDYYQSYKIVLKNSLRINMGKLQVKFISWYEETPPDLEEFFLHYCKQIFNARNDKNIVKSKKMWELNVSYFSPQESENYMLLTKWKSLLKKYKNFNFYMI